MYLSCLFGRPACRADSGGASLVPRDRTTGRARAVAPVPSFARPPIKGNSKRRPAFVCTKRKGSRCRNLDPRSQIPFEAPSSSGGRALHRDGILFESFLVNWLFFEDLAPEQQAILEKFLARCGVAADRRSLAASVFGQFHTSLRATFVGITQAMMNTWLSDKRDGQRLGDAFGLIQELLDIQGENSALSSDNQFQLIVRLAPDALEKLDRATSFVRGQNHIFQEGLSDLLSTVSRDRPSRTGSRPALLLDARRAFRANSHPLAVWALALGSRKFGRARGRQPPTTCRPLARIHIGRKTHPSSACGTRPVELRCAPELCCRTVKCRSTAIFECNLEHGSGIR